MRKRTRAVGLFCCSALAVYAGRPASFGAAVRETRTDEPAVPAVPAAPAVPATGPVVTASGTATGTGTSVRATQVTVSDGGTIEMHVNNAPLLEVLRMLSLQTQRNIVATKDVTGTVSANLYGVTVREALDAILQANGMVYREQGNFIYVYTPKELADQERASRQVQTQVFRLYYSTAADAVVMIKPVLSVDAQVASSAAAATGIDQSGAKGTGGNSHATEETLVVTDYPANLELVRKVLKEVDRRPKQILIEATILTATLTDDNSLGVDFAVLGGVDFDKFLAAPVTTIANAAAGGLTTTTGAAAGSGVGNYGVGQTNFTSALPPGGLRVGYLSNSVSVFVQALESVTNATVLSNPKVLALDKQKGEVIVGRQDGYLTSTVTETAKIETVEFLDTGTRLIFRPFVGDDGYVRLEVHPEDSSGGLSAANLPYKQTTEVTSNLLVKDGHTVVIGGLFREASNATRGQVPLLGDIPLVGTLFRQQRDVTTREEVIILLTPHIVKDESAYAAQSADELRKAEEYRVGVRRGMMFFGRERLAEGEYDRAVAELNKPGGDRGLAMFHLNAATNLNPTFSEAVDLKQKVSGRQVTSVDNSEIRRFVAAAILADGGPAKAAPAEVEIGARPVPGGRAAATPAVANLPTGK